MSCQKKYYLSGFLILVCGFFLTVNSYAQASQSVNVLDSLANDLIEYSAQDEFRVQKLLKYAAALDGVDASKMKTVADEALQLAKTLSDSNLELESLFYVGLSEFNLGQLSEAYTCFKTIEESFTSDQIESVLADAKSGKAKVYSAYGRVTDALENYLSALRVFEQVESTERVADTQHEIGVVYTKQGNFDEALNYYSNAIESYGKSGNLRKMAFICVDKADLVRDLGRYDEALIGYQDALGVFEKYGYNGGATIAHLNMGRLYLQNGDLKNAEARLMSAASFNQKDGNPRNKVGLDLALAELYHKKRSVNKSEQFFQVALTKARELSLLEEQLQALTGLKELAEESYNFKKALEYSTQFIGLSDSLNSINQRNDLNAVKANHELEISENQNMILQKEKDLQVEAAAKQRAITVGIIVVLVVISISSIFLFNAYKNQKNLGLKLTELNQKIASQYESLELANKEISFMNEKLELRVQERTKSLLEKNQQLENYAFKHSHELRAPLSRLMGLVELVKLDAFESPEELKVMVKGLDISALELDEIIRQMAEDLDKRDLFVGGA